MMFLFAGIPHLYYERFKERARKELSQSDYFTGLPLHPSGGGFSVDEHYCRDLVSSLVAFVEQRPQALDNGLGVVLVLRPWERSPGIEELFWPFAIAHTFFVDGQVSKVGEGARRMANKYASGALEAATALRRPVSALNTEFTARIRRTPLLLPLQHFADATLAALLRQVLEGVKQSANPGETIKELCDQFESDHPYERRGDRSGGFRNSRKVNFTAPGRLAFHGKRPDLLKAPHNDRCFLNSRVRLGGSFADGFHYDCTSDGKPHAGEFGNCHNEQAPYRGDPHLNVYPNDFIRG